MDRTLTINLYRTLLIVRTLIETKQLEFLDDESKKLKKIKPFGLSTKTNNILLEIVHELNQLNFGQVNLKIKAILEDLKNELFQEPCPKRWDDLIGVPFDKVKFCSECKKNVYLVKTREELIKRSKAGQCVSIDLSSFEKFFNEYGSKEFGCTILYNSDDDLTGLPI
jgi:hypothetical protein